MPGRVIGDNNEQRVSFRVQRVKGHTCSPGCMRRCGTWESAFWWIARCLLCGGAAARARRKKADDLWLFFFLLSEAVSVCTVGFRNGFLVGSLIAEKLRVFFFFMRKCARAFVARSIYISDVFYLRIDKDMHIAVVKLAISKRLHVTGHLVGWCGGKVCWKLSWSIF